MRHSVSAHEPPHIAENRRHKRHVKLARRYRILAYWPERVGDPRAMNAHVRCNCFDDPRGHGRGRRTIEERASLELERRAW